MNPVSENANEKRRVKSEERSSTISSANSFDEKSTGQEISVSSSASSSSSTPGQLKAVPYNLSNNPVQKKENSKLQDDSSIINTAKSTQLKAVPYNLTTAPVQRMDGKEEEESLQMKSKVVQRKGDEEEESLQMKSKVVQKVESESSLSEGFTSDSNNTGLPDQLKSGIESLSGQSMDDVNVHYNSSKPAQLQAHAYAQGTDIHLGSGQEKHLPHEAWHVVQQNQGRVKPTMQMKGKVNVNDDAGLEKEADVMGAKAQRLNSSSADFGKANSQSPKQLKANDTYQLRLNMKDSGPAERTTGSARDLRREIRAVLERNQINEINADINRLEISIEHRENDQEGRDTSTQTYRDHQFRIDLEYDLLKQLRDAKRILRPRKPKKKKKKVSSNGWTTVGG